MKNKIWLRALLLGLVAALMLTAMAGCGKDPVESDPDASDTSDVSQESSDPSTDDSSDTSTDESTTPSGDENPDNTTSGSNTTTTGGKGTTTKAPTNTTTKASKTTASKTVTGTQISGDVGNDSDNNTVIDSDVAVNGMAHLRDVEMPKRTVKSGKVTVFSWRDQQSDNCYGGSKPDLRPVYKDAGIETIWYQATHSNYMEALSAAIASQHGVDLVEWNATKMYPAAIASGLVVPIDPYINWNDKIWDDVRGLTAKYQINGKTYFSVEYMQIAEFVYYDPQLIKKSGLETPLELWRKGQWTMKALQNISDKLAIKDSSGKLTRYGFVPGAIGAITGIEMVEYNRANGYKLNITNAKFKTLMNIMAEMGVNGTGSAGFTTPANVQLGTVVMSMTAGWAMTNEMNDARERGQLEWCIYPKLDANSKHYYNLTLQQTFALAKGAPNAEAAAYLIELRKWAFLCYPWNEALPFKNTAYTKKYGEKIKVEGSGDQGQLTQAEIDYTTEMLSQGYDVVANNLWAGWVGNGQFPGITEVVSNGKTWANVLELKKPALDAVLKQWKFK